ncbi:Imm74 family immunity protein [Anatilimnocola sp. NA78]|uniref:Imm74 family immunity protein n=1 Tax=Anatilimnocola sp. NA78 TaxID=3415683 RepID=UPI003CE58367
MIIELSRGHITLRSGTRTIEVQGELLGPPPYSPNFVVYADRILNWEDGSPVSVAERDSILELLRDDMAARGLSIEIER